MRPPQPEPPEARSALSVDQNVGRRDEEHGQRHRHTQAAQDGARERRIGLAAGAEFHLALGALAHNELFRLLLGVVGGVMTEVRRQLAYVPGARDVVMTDHQRILDAVVARDAAAARQALEDHLAHSQVIVREFGEELLRKNWR